jgi:glutamate 5-kinase
MKQGLEERSRVPEQEFKRIVIKVGTSTLTDAQGCVDRGYIADLAAQIAALTRQGREVLLVSSGAIRAGKEALARTRHLTPKAAIGNALPFKQACAAIGQGVLMHSYQEAFEWRNVPCAQILLTRDDLGDRKRFLNARNTLHTLLELGVVPIINENDTVAVEEIKFGDNDTLAALVATLIEADLLIILSDIDGLYDRLPTEPDASLISTVTRIDSAIAALGGEATSGMGTGGMRTQIEAARIALSAGIRTVIAHGRQEKVLADIIGGTSVGTTFLPSEADKLSARKRWIAHSPRSQGAVWVNAKAKDSLRQRGGSVLAAGIVGVSGAFGAGDLVELCDEAGNVFGRGLTNYAATEVRRVLGLRSEQFEIILGYRGSDEIIHRDNLVLEKHPHSTLRD